MFIKERISEYEKNQIRKFDIYDNIIYSTTTFFPTVSQIYAKTLASELVSVSPLKSPTGTLFYLDYKY